VLARTVAHGLYTGNLACMPATALDGAFSCQNPNAHQEHYDQEGNKPEYELCHNGKPWTHMCWKPMTALPGLQIKEIYLVARKVGR
jgi:hypothetical protein